MRNCSNPFHSGNGINVGHLVKVGVILVTVVLYVVLVKNVVYICRNMSGTWYIYVTQFTLNSMYYMM